MIMKEKKTLVIVRLADNEDMHHAYFLCQKAYAPDSQRILQNWAALLPRCAKDIKGIRVGGNY